MRSKTPLVLMEQMVMVLVFALAAAICLRAFVLADTLSRRGETRDQAVMLTQSAAELIRHEDGDIAAALTRLTGIRSLDATAAFWSVEYDRDWNIGAGNEGIYRLTVRPVDAAVPGLGEALVSVTDLNEGETLFALQVAWQEVSGHD